MNMGEHQTMDEWEGGEDDDEGDAAEDLHGRRMGRRYCAWGSGVCARVVDTVGKVFDEINGNSADWVC